ncbi:NADH-dependent butanol dehydrogenase A [hydrothermal vent metagenome]|uniref:NADH-dependent butanol dehydrogenase A n=1 Tax=hydrothermal vent metagenome TaxID=652676 RepID=A0A3B1C4J8_9ZZZZ
MLLTGMGSVKKAGLYDKALHWLKEAGVAVTKQTGVKPNPDISLIREAALTCKKEGVDIIVAIGGGSVIDSAKAIAAGAMYDGDPWDFFTKKIRVRNPLPVGALLTLAATGSEMNGNVVISNRETEEKLGMYHPKLYPAFSILDPTLTYSVSAEQTAYGAVDILSHLFEQYFHSVPHASLQDGFAETIMQTVIKSAPLAIGEPLNYGARANILWSSTLALNGLVGAGVKGDWACHMIEHELSAKYDIAHGAGLALIFPAWMKHVYKANIGKFVQFAVKVWGIDPSGKSDEDIALAGIEATKNYFRKELQISVSLAGYGIDGSRLREMALSATKQGPLGSVMLLSAEDVEAIFQEAL